MLTWSKCCLLLLLLLNGVVASTTSTWTLSQHGIAVRGGGTSFFQRIFRPNPQQIYRQSLEEQVLLLDQQLRQAREELIGLRDRRKEFIKNQKISRFVVSGKEQRKAIQKEQTLLQQKIESMLIQLEQMERMKVELEELLQASNLRIQELEAKLVEQHDLTRELEENYKQQIAAIKASLADTAAQQSSQFEAMQQERIRQAADAARQEAMLEVEERISQVTEDLQAQHEKAMQAERQRSIKAVELEKKKMRKLVKALAIREKKLLAKAARDRNKTKKTLIDEIDDESNEEEEERENVESTAGGESSGSSSFHQRPKTTPTTRGFI